MDSAPDIRKLAPLAGSMNRIIQPVAFSLFFFLGGVTSLNDVLMPKLKSLFHLNYTQMTLVQFCFFTGYFLVSIPAAFLISRVGLMRAATAGLALMALGCFLFVPAANSAFFPAFLAALFVVAAGVTVVQVTANPLVMSLGRATTTPARLTFAHACNSVGTVVAPFIGAIVILNPASLASGAEVVSGTYVSIGAFLALVALVVYSLRNHFSELPTAMRSPLDTLSLLKNKRVLFGVIALFLYVGAEVTVGSMLVNYLGLPRTMRFEPETAGKYLSFYWGGQLVGRLIGVIALRFVLAPQMVAAYAAAAFCLVVSSMSLSGDSAGWAMLAVGLFNSVMFPLIFALTSEGLGARMAEGAGLCCVAIVGGAIVPVFTGSLADATNLTTAFVVPAICYVGILSFGLYALKFGGKTVHI